MNPDDSTVTLTFCECAENQKGMQQLGTIAEDGYTVEELETIASENANCELVYLNELLTNEEDVEAAGPAALLIIRGGLDLICGEGTADALAEEMFALEWDKKKFRYGKVQNSKARHNLCFDRKSQTANYGAKEGTVVAFDDVPVCKKVRRRLPRFFGEKAKKLKCEGNAYYDWKECYISFHGDSERKRVIAVRLGHKMSLYYKWYKRSQRISKVMKLTLYHGDIYIMSEKAVGSDWIKKKTIPTLRHAAGTKRAIEKYTKKKIND